MNWPDERYVRVYTRDTTEWVLLGWQAQCVFVMMMRKADRAGVLDIGKHGARGLAALLRMPEDVVSEGLAVLLDDGCIEQHGTSLLIPNFIEAQEAVASPTLRQRQYRERERDAIRAGLPSSSQTACVVYVLQSEHGGPVKVGRAEDLAKRLSGLQTGRVDRLIVLAAVQGTREDERLCHDALEAHQERGEWFTWCDASKRLVQAMKDHDTDVWGLLRASPVTLLGDAPSTGSVTSNVSVTPSVPARTVPSVPSVPPSQEASEPEPPKPVQTERGSWPPGVLEVWDAYRIVEKHARDAPSFPEADKITAAIRREGGHQRIIDGMKGHSMDDFTMKGTPALRRLERLLAPEWITAGIARLNNGPTKAQAPPGPQKPRPTVPLSESHAPGPARDVLKPEPPPTTLEQRRAIIDAAKKTPPSPEAA